MRWQPLFVTAISFFLVLFQPQLVDAVAPPARVLGSNFPAKRDTFLGLALDPETVSQFEKKVKVVTEQIPFETEYKEDSDLPWGEEEIVQEGKPGEEVLTYEISYWYGEEVSRKLLEREVQEPVPEVISRGTKIEWKEVPGKGYKYWAKLENCWATSYDGNCEGCRGLTYSGTEVKHGVCAVDPEVIPLGTNFYVPGYGICRAEDIGGAVDGNDVDLGFEDVSKGFWSARHVDVYLLTNAPE
ncbi:MAG: G5 domain-containing protein [Patescibacteria group bacterium]|nr:G5 domain-containing protein [Patescibacteria group bacterium]